MVTKRTKKIELLATTVATSPSTEYQNRGLLVARPAPGTPDALSEALAKHFTDAGYVAEVTVGGGIRVRRNVGPRLDAKARVSTHVKRIYSGSAGRGAHFRGLTFVVSNREYGRGGSRYAIELAIDTTPAEWTFRYALNVSGLLAAAEQELQQAERSEAYEQERIRAEKAAEAIAVRFRPAVEAIQHGPHVVQIALTVNPHNADGRFYGIEVTFAPSDFTGADVLPYVRLFPEGIVTTDHTRLTLDGLTGAQMEAVLFGSSGLAALQAFNRALEQALR